MGAIIDQVVSAVISGLVGGTVTGIAAFAAIRVEIKYLRRDVDHAHRRLDYLERHHGAEDWEETA